MTVQPQPPSDEPGLIARAREQDAAAFEVLVTRYAPRVWRVVVRLVGDSDAPDVVQQTFVAAWQGLDRFKGDQPLWPWLSSIATHRALNWLRSRKRAAVESMETSHERLPDRQAGPEALAEQGESARQVQAAVRRLPPTAAAIVTLHYAEGLTCGDIGRQLGMGESAVKVALFRARQKLRDWLQGRDGDAHDVR